MGNNRRSYRSRRKGFLSAIATLAGVLGCAPPLSAQLPGNASLKGSYYIRYLGFYEDSAKSCTEDLKCRLTFHGVLTFDGQGNYQLSGQGTTSNATSSQSPLTAANSGQYIVLSSGVFEISNPFDAAGKAALQGGLGQGGAAIVASSGGWNYHDLLIGIPVSTTASNATLNGKYYVADFAFSPTGLSTSSGPLYAGDSTFYSMAADGKGAFGGVTVIGASPAAGAAAPSYSLKADGSGTLSLPASGLVSYASPVVSGDKQLYVSPDGGIFIAGGASAYEMIIGVKAWSGGAPNDALQGTYFFGGLEKNPNGTFNDFGAVNEIPALKTEVGDYWETSAEEGAYDFTFQQDFTFAADGTRSNSEKHWAVGAGGMFVVGAGVDSLNSISLRVKGPAMSGSGVFLNPQGIVNAANNAPFTSNVAPGELISLYGSGLASQTVIASGAPWPTTLGGVQVLIGGTPAPLYFVSPNQVSAVVPFSFPTDYSLQDVKVINNGAASNSVQVAARQTSPGIFTIPAGGLGSGAILHAADYSVVTASNPAKAGETVILFVTGLGGVTPAVADGVPGPSTPPSTVDASSIGIYFSGHQGKILFAGLAPTLIGLYQLNVTVPAGVAAGNAVIEIDTTDGTTSMATIPIGQ